MSKEELAACGITFLGGITSLLSSRPAARIAGMTLIIISVMTLVFFLVWNWWIDYREQQGWRRRQQFRIEERLNDLEVWREETLTEPDGIGARLDTLRDRVDNLETGLTQKRGGNGVWGFFLITLAGLLVYYGLEELSGGRDGSL